MSTQDIGKEGKNMDKAKIQEMVETNKKAHSKTEKRMDKECTNGLMALNMKGNTKRAIWMERVCLIKQVERDRKASAKTT